MFAIGTKAVDVAADGASKVVIRLSEPICGDCCIEKSFIKGVLTLEDVRVGNPNVTFVYDPSVTTPQKILAELAKKGKKGEVVSLPPAVGGVGVASANPPKETNWIRPRKRG